MYYIRKEPRSLPSFQMNVLIAPDKFKGSLSAYEVSRSIANGLVRFVPGAAATLHPMADGGEGSLLILEDLIGAERVYHTVHDPLFRTIETYYLLKNRTAYIELAMASGLELLSPSERSALHTTTLGTGELIADALVKGAEEIFLFIGGSATNDAGLGMAQALGYTLLDEEGVAIRPTGDELSRLAHIETTNVLLALRKAAVKVVCDVKNPLHGPEGAAYMYAAQKGATPEQIALLDQGLKNVGTVVKKELGMAVEDLAGAGAAGGVGAGAVAFLGAEILPGVQTFMEITDFKRKLAQADLLVTGEGKLDTQTLQGKVVHGLLQAAREQGVPSMVVCGINTLTPEQTVSLGLVALGEVMAQCTSQEQAMEQASAVVEQLTFEMIQRWANSKK